MTFTPAQFRRLLADDERTALPFERIPPEEQRQRRLAPPATNLGSGRGRFRIVLDRLAPLLRRGGALCDVGAYPGTALRLARTLPGGGAVAMTGVGLGFAEDFRAAMSTLSVDLHELEFDVRLPPSGAEHILTCPVRALGGPFDICLCTEVLEHQVHPASLLLGLSRLTRPGGVVLLTTNSVSFVGDIAKLAAGRHNVEALERSHVLCDSDWRPHIRLYTRTEVENLVGRAGFEVIDARYFDNGNVYAGPKGLGIGALRALAGRLAHLRSHVLVVARRSRDPDPALHGQLRRMVSVHGLDAILGEAHSGAAP
jgi:SAM-dependent methyltransferase